MVKDKHWWITTSLGIAGATLGALATTANIDKLTPGQLLMAVGGCLWTAAMGYFSPGTTPKPE